MKKLFVFIPAFGRTITVETSSSLFQLGLQCARRGIEIGCATVSSPDLTAIRNRMLSYWYDCRPDIDHLLMVDSDMGFPPDLVFDMEAADKPLVGAVYRKKKGAVEYVLRTFPTPRPIVDGLMEVEGLGCGVMLIRRDCVDAMLAHDPGLIDPVPIAKQQSPEFLEQLGLKRILLAFDSVNDPEIGRLSEDFSFCHRYRQAGGKVYAHVGHELTHIGYEAYRGRYSDFVAQFDGIALEQRKPSPVLTREYIEVRNCRHGMFAFNKNDTFIGRSLQQIGEWCEFEIDLLTSLVGSDSVAVDIGANIGTHTVPLAKVCKGVIAFEPQDAIREILEANVGLNRLGNVTVRGEPVSSRVVDITITELPLPTQEFNFGGVPLGGDGQRTKTAVTLDSLALDRVDLIKIDVEGMEADVINGSRETISRCRPVLYVENNGPDSRSLWEALEAIGYKGYWSIGPYFNPNNFLGETVSPWPNVEPSANVMAVPKSASVEIEGGMPELTGPHDNWRLALSRRTRRPEYHIAKSNHALGEPA